jgi:hypothetical protein
VIKLFKRQKVFSFSISTSIGDGGIGYPEDGTYRSYFEAKNAAREWRLEWMRWVFALRKLIALISHGREIKAILPVIKAQDSLKVPKGDK